MRAPQQSFKVSVLVSVALHAALILIVFSGWAPTPIQSEVRRPNVVQAELVTLESRSKQEEKADRPRVTDLRQQQEQARIEEQRRAEQRRQQEVKRQQEADRQKEAERQREAERKRQADAEKKRQERERQEAERRRAEAERQKQEQLRRQQEQQAFEEALAREESQMREAAYADAAQSYMSAISQRIEQNWSRPPSARNNMECELSIKLVPTGRVINVDIVRSSGNAQFDRSAVQAVQRVEQFPEVRGMEPEVFERYYRELNLVFKPQDLRQ